MSLILHLRLNPKPQRKRERKCLLTQLLLTRAPKTNCSKRTKNYHGLLDEVWNAHVDIDDASTKADLLAAFLETCEILNEFDDARFPFDTDESAEAELDEEAA